MLPQRYDGFECHNLDDVHQFFTGRLPGRLVLTEAQFAALWNLHPQDYHEIKIHGRLVKTPRWQQAYDADYHYTGRVNKALPLLPLLQPLKQWARETIDERLVGVLVNWYDGLLGHYIGKHRDSTKGMVPGAPIVTVSFGEERTFRLRPWKGSGQRDFLAIDGTVFIEPFETNLAWTHEVPRASRYLGRRVSVTFRAFNNGVLGISEVGEETSHAFVDR